MQRNVYFKTVLFSVQLAFCTSVAAQAQTATEDSQVTAQIEDAEGNPVGAVTISQLEHGVLFSANLRNLPSGGHGFYYSRKRGL